MKNIAFLITLFSLTTHPAFAFPLSVIENRLEQLKQNHLRPIAVFDLDETLIHSAKRKVLSYQKALEINHVTLIQKWPHETEAAETRIKNAEELMRSLFNQYDSNSFFKRMGIQDASFIQALDALMLPIYLSNEFIPEDTAYRGAVQLLQLIYRAKGSVNFVSSRFQSSQESGTIKNLVDQHLYRNSKQSFIRLRNDGERSLDFKRRVFAEINAGIGKDESVFIVGENEPENFNALTEFFPNALAIFVTGAVMNTSVTVKNVPDMIITKDFVNH